MCWWGGAGAPSTDPGERMIYTLLFAPWTLPIQLPNKHHTCLFRRKRILKNILFCLVIRFVSHAPVHKLVLGLWPSGPGLRSQSFWLFPDSEVLPCTQSLSPCPGHGFCNKDKTRPHLGRRPRNHPAGDFTVGHLPNRGGGKSCVRKKQMTLGNLCSYSFFFFFFLGLHLWHMEVPRLGVESELQLPTYTTATAMQDPSRGTCREKQINIEKSTKSRQRVIQHAKVRPLSLHHFRPFSSGVRWTTTLPTTNWKYNFYLLLSHCPKQPRQILLQYYRNLLSVPLVTKHTICKTHTPFLSKASGDKILATNIITLQCF